MASEKHIFIKAAGFIVKVIFEECEVKTYQDEIIKGVEKVWGKNKLTAEKLRNFDFTIRFIWPDEARLTLIQKGNGSKIFLLTFERNFKQKVITLYYHAGLQVFDACLREALSYLLSEENKGFLLHGSSCLDKKGLLHIFMAKTGGGKSTLKKLLEEKGFSHFSDDMLIIKKGKDWNSYSPPFIEKEDFPDKRKAKKMRFYFVKKSKKPKIEKLLDRSDILKKTLEQIWLREPNVSSKLLSLAADFVEENKFYNIESVLNPSKMKGILDET